MATYEEVTTLISGAHTSDKVKEAYHRIMRHLFLSRPDLVDDLVKIEMDHEKLHRQTFGLQARVTSLEKDKETLKRKLYGKRAI